MKMADQIPKYVVGKLISMKARTSVKYLASVRTHITFVTHEATLTK
jgi:hypothetical protein